MLLLRFTCCCMNVSGVCKYFTLVFLVLSSHKLCTLVCSDITICSSSVIWTSSSKIAICCSTRTTTHPLDTADCGHSFGWFGCLWYSNNKTLPSVHYRQDITMETNIFHSYVHQYCEQKWMVEHNKIKGMNIFVLFYYYSMQRKGLVTHCNYASISLRAGLNWNPG